MLLVNFSKVTMDYASNPVFDDVDLEILEGERIGLVGENGAGKSTLFKLLVGIDTPTEGIISRKRNLTIGYLTQEADPRQSHKTVFEAVSEVSAEHSRLSSTLEELEAQMSDPEIASDPDQMEQLLNAYGQAQERYEAAGGYTLGHQVEAVLSGLGFQPAQLQQQVGALSGGEKKLVNLARLLLQKPDLLLLDEPDNHLDIDARTWLENYIQAYPGTVLIISHDRHLLDRVVKKIYELQDGAISTYVGNYTSYFQERQQRLLKQQETWSLQQEEIKRLEASARQLIEWAKMNPKFAGRAHSMEKRAERARNEAVARPIMERDRIKINLDSDRSGQRVLTIKKLGKSFGKRVLFRPFDFDLLYGERVGIVGANGSGKTTLLRMIMEMGQSEESPEVKIGASVISGYYAQEQETLPLDKTPMDLVRNLRPKSEGQAIGLLRRLLFSYNDIHNPIRNLSGGEKSRLQIVRLMLTDANFLMLDEPTNNLDLPSVEVLEEALLQFKGTILTVSHDRYFLDKIVTRILAIEPDGQVGLYHGNFSEYYEQSRLVK